jgi:hypothetical protein
MVPTEDLGEMVRKFLKTTFLNEDDRFLGCKKAVPLHAM